MAIVKDSAGNYRVYTGNHKVYNRIEGESDTTFTATVWEFLTDPNGPIVACEGCGLMMMKTSDDCHFMIGAGFPLCVDCPDDGSDYPTKFPETCR